MWENVQQNVQQDHMSKQMGEYLTIRKGVWHFVRRVPSEYQALDLRGIVKLSTKVRVANDRAGTKAGRVAARMNATHEAHWRLLAERNTTEARQTYADAVKLARSLGVDYLPSATVATRPIGEILTRVEMLENHRVEQAPLRRAALGGYQKPKIMLSELFSEYELTQRTNLSKMSPDQVRKWTSAKKRAVEILIERNGDKGLHELTRDDALSYADWWEDRVIIEGLDAGTANKNISHIGGMIRAVNKRHDLRLDAVFAGTRIGGGKDSSRKPFDVDFIVNVVLADGQLANLNDEARDIVYTLIETGARPSEIINLSQHCIVLDAAIPHIRIIAEGRVLKTEQSEREIPLVGIALDAMRRHPNGFPRYFDKGSSLSATLQKHFKSRGLLPSDRHSVYSFRHSFKDRLKSVEAPEELIDEMMGHTTAKPKYGDGYGLKLKLKYLQATELRLSRSASADAVQQVA
jgi:integrase